MTFHGEFVSLPEVCSCVLLLTSILTSLCCRQEHVAKLYVLADRIVHNSWSQSMSFETSPTATIHNTMLYRSFGEFERGFGQYFQSQKDCKAELFQLQKSEGKQSSSFNQLLKRIKGVYCSRSRIRKSFKFGGEHNANFSCSKMCANIGKVRNDFAHNNGILVKDVFRALEDIHELLKAFN